MGSIQNRGMYKYLSFLAVISVGLCTPAQTRPLRGAAAKTASAKNTSIAVPTTTILNTKNRLTNEKQDSKNELKARIEGQSYLQSSELADASEQVMNFDHKYNFLKNNHKVRTHLIFGGYANNQFVYAAAPEAYYQYTNTDSFAGEFSQSFSVGRKVLETSQIDRTFNLGLTNSFFTQDFIKFQDQGLVGFHQQTDARSWGFNLSLLPIYLPNQGPAIKESNGKILGSNRWVKKPPSQFAFNDSNKEIVYTVNYDQLSKLVLTPGAHAQVRIGELDNTIHLVSSYSKRPMNEPVLERETFADLNVIGKVNLIPNAIYNELLTTDLRYQTDNFKSAISYVSDRPENKVAREFYSIQVLSPITGYSLFLEYTAHIFQNREFLIGAAIAEFKGGEVIDINSDGTENIFTFTKQRLQYKKPIQILVQSDLFEVSGRTLRSRLKWLYDREQKGTVLTSEINFQAMVSLSARVGLDIIGTEEQKTEDIGFIQQFQANDRVYGGLEYVF